MIKLSELLQITNGSTSYKGKDIVFSSVCTDSRNINNGSVFIPLKGPNFDGHDFVVSALNKGAKAAIVSKAVRGIPKGKILIHMSPSRFRSSALPLFSASPLSALHLIAAHHRQKWGGTLIAVTGSSGKTTTKDMIASVMAQKGKTLKTQENLNNEIGVPLTLLRLNKNHDFAVVEMGMRGRKEIEPLSKISSPDIAVITNTGDAHIGILKSKKAIAAAKSEIFSGLSKDGIAVLNSDDEYFGLMKKAAGKRQIITFGIDKTAYIRAANIVLLKDRVKFSVRLSGFPSPATLSERERVEGEHGRGVRGEGLSSAHGGEGFTVPLPGRHNVYNALCAVAAGLLCGMTAKQINKGLSKFKPSAKRTDIRVKHGVTVINDSYNASPSSMKAALEMLAAQKTGGRRIAVIGDMLELGKTSVKAHKNIGALARKLGIDMVVAVGKDAEYYLSGSQAPDPRPFFPDNFSASKFLRRLLKPRDIVLVKASRGMKFEQIAEKILDTDI